ncbi:MAG TPA: cupin domain-containing protein [Mesorhizobium sp.]|uniref:cupin domain-containing protein n=1 Tax=Mesorhizobium sp. TaxID=1871066 RepID=UPI002DDD96A0|nr:cupin domain-containing protein [Mesorhizobium sp.]HEV2506594.1 cupin domain-containing protein [Mesorhizobium sp.]
MHETMATRDAIAGLAVGITTSAQPSGAAKLSVLYRKTTTGLPTQETQEIRVLLARLDPGDCTPHHSHRHPVTIYMLEGTFTLELEGHAPLDVKAGEVFVEPAHVAMTGRNLSTDTPARMVIFYASKPDTPFADPVA